METVYKIKLEIQKFSLRNQTWTLYVMCLPHFANHSSDIVEHTFLLVFPTTNLNNW